MCLERGANDLHNGPANVTAPFWCRLIQVVLEKRPLSGCFVCKVVEWRCDRTMSSTATVRNDSQTETHAER